MNDLIFDNAFLDGLLAQAAENPRLRQSFDLRTSGADTSQRMLNAVMPGTVVPVHQHADTSETVVCLRGRLEEVFYEECEAPHLSPSKEENAGPDSSEIQFREVRRIPLCPAEGRYGCQVPKGAWHTIEVKEPSVIFEAKDGAYKKSL